MKHQTVSSSLCITLLLVAAWSLSPAQTTPGTVELSFSGRYESVSTSIDGTDSPSSMDYAAIAFAPAYFVTSRISLEPEVLFMSMKNSLPSYILSGNVSIILAGTPGKAALFVRTGYGVGNSIPLLGIPVRSSDKFDIPVFNLGGGIKYFITESVALRMEYRYQRFSRSYETYTYTSYIAPPLKTTRTAVTGFSEVLFGLSVFLPNAQ